MKAFVFTDKALASQAGRFVWLALDSENGKNARTFKKFPVNALPSFLVIAPDSERVVMRWVGGMNVNQLVAFLGDAERAAGGGQPNALARADRFYGAAQYAEAVPAYEEAIATAPEHWSDYPRAVEALLYSMADQEKYEESAELAEKALPKLVGTPSELTAAAYGLDGALQLKPDHPKRAAWMHDFEERVTRLIEDPKLQVAVDDRSGAYGSLVDARKESGDSAGAHRVAEKWAKLLEDAAKKAPTPAQRTVFDSHRLAAYRELGEPARALPMLEQSERDFPEDYNPPYRLSIALTDLKRWDEAVAASDRALARAYGPRKLLIYRARADLMAAKGDRAGAHVAMEQAIGYARSMPPEQISEASMKSLQKKLESFSTPADSSAQKATTK